MRRLFWMLAFFGVLVGCGDGAVVETAVPDPTPTAIAVNEAEVEDEPPPTALPTATLPTVVETAVPVQDPVEPQPVEPDLEQEVTPEIVETAVPVEEPSGEGLGAGQRATALVAAGETAVYPFTGIRFASLLFFAEPKAEVDLALRIYSGSEATGQPNAEIDFAGAGIPELGVFTPQADGAYLLEVVNLGTETAEIDAYAFSSTTATALAAVQQTDSLVAGATGCYTVRSNGARPVLIYAAATDQAANLVINATDGAGNQVGTADFTGAGSSEALFLLPLRQTEYTFEINEAGGGAASYELLIVPLE